MNWNNRKVTGVLILLFFIFLSFFSVYYTHLLNGKIIIGDDIEFHKNRIEGLYEAISNGVWFPKLNMIMMNTMGYASSIFYSDFFLYIPALFRLIGFSISEAYISFMVIINFFTFVISYTSFYSIKNSLTKSFLFSLLFTTAPYRLLDLTTRAALGELLALTFLPLAFAGLYHILYGEPSKWYFLAIGMTFIIYSHILSAVMFALLVAIFLILNTKQLIKQRERVLSLIYSVVLTIALTLTYFIPVLEQTLSQSFKVGNNPIFYMSEKATDLGSLIVNSLSNKGTPNLGILLLIFLVIYSVIIYKIKDKKIKDIYFVAVLLFIVVTNLFPWKLLDQTFFNTIQFPWRFLGFVSLLVCWIVAEDPLHWVLKDKKKMASVCFLSLFLLISYTVNMRVNAPDEEVKSYEEFNQLDLSYLGAGKEYLPQSSDYDVLKEQPLQPTYDKEQLKIDDYNKNRDRISFTFDSESKQKITLPLIYYKGYTAEIAGDGIVSQPFLDKEENGQLSVIVNGKGEITIQYKETFLQNSMLFLSAFSWIVLLNYFIYKYFREKSNVIKKKV